MRDPTVDLERLITLDRSSLRLYLSIGAIVIVLGAVVAATGFFVQPGASGTADGFQTGLVKLGGLVMSAFSTFPLKQWFDRRERISYMQSLQLTWKDLASMKDPPLEDLQRIRSIIWALYEARVRG